MEPKDIELRGAAQTCRLAALKGYVFIACLLAEERQHECSRQGRLRKKDHHASKKADQ